MFTQTATLYWSIYGKPSARSVFGFRSNIFRDISQSFISWGGRIFTKQYAGKFFTERFHFSFQLRGTPYSGKGKVKATIAIKRADQVARVCDNNANGLFLISFSKASVLKMKLLFHGCLQYLNAA